MKKQNINAGRQRGVVLIITLIALVAMTLAAIALIRSVDTGNVVAGNMAFKQGAVLAGDSGTEAAINWLSAIAGVAASQADIPSSGYYATSQETLDMTGNSGDLTRPRVDWDKDNCGGLAVPACIEPSPLIAANAAGYEARYVIHRLCPAAGLANNCASTATTVAGTSSGAKDYTTKGGLSGEVQVEYYRITTRVRGPRNTTSFVETIVFF
ncbi:MAG: pilus assembly protein PilX [Nitrosomonadales bacterium]|nr:pilus assembly protein PilX [Nitrosomonadales bacterium]